MKTWLQPRTWERRYARLLSNEFKLLKVQIENELLSNLTEDLTEKKQNNYLIAFHIGRLLLYINARTPEIRRIYTTMRLGVNQFNDTQFRLVLRDLSGLTIAPSQSVGIFNDSRLISPTAEVFSKFGEAADIYRQEPYLSDIASNWDASQENYIVNSLKETVNNAELLARTALGNSLKRVALQKMINSKVSTNEARVTAFAANSVSSLNTQLMRERAQSMGINNYIWETQKDERVRGNPTGLYPKAKPSHHARQGKIFRWDQPPEGGAPGEAYGCRCYAVIRLRK